VGGFCGDFEDWWCFRAGVFLGVFVVCEEGCVCGGTEFMVGLLGMVSVSVLDVHGSSIGGSRRGGGHWSVGCVGFWVVDGFGSFGGLGYLLFGGTGGGVGGGCIEGFF